MIITFFGHSDFVGSASLEEKLLAILRDQINDSEAELLLGDYGGFDRFVYDCVRKYKKENTGVKLVLVTPYIDRKRKEYGKYDEIVYPPLENVPYKFAIVERNKWMVDQADVIILCVEREYGGAFQAVKRARKKNKRIINIVRTE